jgi:hypothetical protein
LQPKQSIPNDKYQRIAAVHNFNIGQWSWPGLRRAGSTISR